MLKSVLDTTVKAVSKKIMEMTCCIDPAPSIYSLLESRKSAKPKSKSKSK